MLGTGAFRMSVLGPSGPGRGVLGDGAFRVGALSPGVLGSGVLGAGAFRVSMLGPGGHVDGQPAPREGRAEDALGSADQLVSPVPD